MIEAYSGYIAAYVWAGVLIYLIAVFAYIKAGETMPDKGPVPMLFFVAIAPLGLAGAILKDILLMCWGASKAWLGIFRKDSGTEELLVGAFWAFMAWTFYDIEQAGSGAMAFICFLTVVYLWQSARAMQLLKKEKAASGEQVDPGLRAFFHAPTLDQLPLVKAYSDYARARRKKLCMEAVHEIREEARGIKERNNERWDLLIDRQRQRAADREIEDSKTLFSIGYHSLGARYQALYYQCQFCGSRYPQIAGYPRMNGQCITECPCLDKTHGEKQ